MRKPTIKSLDRIIFHETATNTKKINIHPTIMRGGIRL